MNVLDLAFIQIFQKIHNYFEYSISVGVSCLICFNKGKFFIYSDSQLLPQCAPKQTFKMWNLLSVQRVLTVNSLLKDLTMDSQHLLMFVCFKQDLTLTRGALSVNKGRWKASCEQAAASLAENVLGTNLIPILEQYRTERNTFLYLYPPNELKSYKNLLSNQTGKTTLDEC